MLLVQNKNEILKNITLLDTYIAKGIEDEKEFVLSLIKKGTCFIANQKGSFGVERKFWVL